MVFSLPKKILLVLLMAFLFADAGFARPVEKESWSNEFDWYFKKNIPSVISGLILNGAGLNLKAKSPRGGVGIMQILPSIFAEIQDDNPGFSDLKILAGERSPQGNFYRALADREQVSCTR